MSKNNCNGLKVKKKYWAIKITIITFFIAILFSFVADIATNRAGIIIASLILILLIIINIMFDGIAVAVTACDKAPLASMASRKVKGSKTALYLKSKADIVASICADVVGDICGVVSGSCIIVIAYQILNLYPSLNSLFLTILFSSVVAAIIVGGKAVMKSISINHSKDVLMSVAKILSIFVKEKKL